MWFSKKRDSNITWTKNLLVDAMLNDLGNSLIPTDHKNVFLINEHTQLKVIFESSNFADKGVVHLIASLFFDLDPREPFTWIALDEVAEKMGRRSKGVLKLDKVKHGWTVD